MALQEIFCEKCERKINNVPVFGEKYFRFKDGYYCQKCAENKVKEKRG